MTDDIVKRLRKLEIELFCIGVDHQAFLMKQAADEIERLRLELEEQRYWNSVLQEQVKYTI